MFRISGKRDRGNRPSATRCGSKGGGSSYDPQVGAAAQANAANAAEAQKWSENYYTNTVAPLLAQETASSQQTQADQKQVFGIDIAQAQKAQAEYNTNGQPAIDAYYKQAKDYSSQDEQNYQAQAAIGDMRTAEASNAGNIARQDASYGIDPTSGVAQGQATAAGVQNSAAEAAAATRARYNAKTMGMQLTADAANYAVGGQSAIPALGGGASSASSAGFGAASGNLAGANSSGAIPLAGYNIAGQGYQSNLDAYSKLGAADINASASSDSALGGAFGSLIGLAGKLPMFGA